MKRTCLIAATILLSSNTRLPAQETAGKQFRSCQHCHQPPDLDFATDRAWLNQVKRTA